MTAQNDGPALSMLAVAYREIVALLDKRHRDQQLRRAELERAGRGRGW